MLSPQGRGEPVIRLGEIVMILDLHRQGANVSTIARRTGLDRKTVRKVIASGLEPPVYGPRPPRVTRLQPFEAYLRERLAAVPELTGRRLHRELGTLGYRGGYSAVTDLLREIRPAVPPPFELRFETPPGQQEQVDFAQFQTEFAVGTWTQPDAVGCRCRCKTPQKCRLKIPRAG